MSIAFLMRQRGKGIADEYLLSKQDVHVENNNKLHAEKKKKTLLLAPMIDKAKVLNVFPTDPTRHSGLSFICTDTFSPCTRQLHFYCL